MATLTSTCLCWVVKRLVPSDVLIEDARVAEREVTAQLTELRIPGALELTGASSTPGALTKGDIDLHLRVQPSAFAGVVARLDEVFARTNLHAWEDTLAVFSVPGARTTELAVTPIGSEHDRRFCLAWERLRSEPQLLQQYNELKRAAFGTPDYDSRKSAFFTRLTAP